MILSVYLLLCFQDYLCWQVQLCFILIAVCYCILLIVPIYLFPCHGVVRWFSNFWGLRILQQISSYVCRSLFRAHIEEWNSLFKDHFLILPISQRNCCKFTLSSGWHQSSQCSTSSQQSSAYKKASHCFAVLVGIFLIPTEHFFTSLFATYNYF